MSSCAVGDTPDETVVALTPADNAAEAEVLAGFFEGTAEPFKRVQASMISDDEAAEMTHVARGALYIPDTEEWDGRT